MPNYSISKKAKIGNNVSVKDFTIIEDDVVIGNNVEIGSNVYIANGARIADNVKIHHGAVVSTVPQDLKFSGEDTVFEIGEGTVIREYATLNRGTKESGKSSLGKNCFIMAYTHIAHDCHIGNNVIIANSVQMGGHVEIGDWAIIGGIVPIHQFTKIGIHVMIGGGFRTVKDVPPYALAGNSPLKFEGINTVGLRRRGFTNKQISDIKTAYDIIYYSGYNVSDAVKKINESGSISDEVKIILKFIAESKRGLVKG
ncbi:MAG: Acyl-[acyl-carrier-protein]--UDP-N-acetylglucosamine O-acyltransferase [Ignavibacteria bacterium]|nr:Acyl-[acyl-carrier-protein]--UDP-N-acetylglucosamine O-acyltransferase [Ignavibacteria bacterium]